MKCRVWLAAGLMVWAFSAQAGADGVALAQQSVCLACHQVDNKRVGPSFRDIASRYAGNDAAAVHLAGRIREGSRGLWGAIPMPAQRHVDHATALLLGEWIMSLAPATGAAQPDGNVANVEGPAGPDGKHASAGGTQ